MVQMTNDQDGPIARNLITDTANASENHPFAAPVDDADSRMVVLARSSQSYKHRLETLLMATGATIKESTVTKEVRSCRPCFSLVLRTSSI